MSLGLVDLFCSGFSKSPSTPGCRRAAPGGSALPEHPLRPQPLSPRVAPPPQRGAAPARYSHVPRPAGQVPGHGGQRQPAAAQQLPAAGAAGGAVGGGRAQQPQQQQRRRPAARPWRHRHFVSGTGEGPRREKEAAGTAPARSAAGTPRGPVSAQRCSAARSIASAAGGAAPRGSHGTGIHPPAGGHRRTGRVCVPAAGSAFSSFTPHGSGPAAAGAPRPRCAPAGPRTAAPLPPLLRRPSPAPPLPARPERRSPRTHVGDTATCSRTAPRAPAHWLAGVLRRARARRHWPAGPPARRRGAPLMPVARQSEAPRPAPLSHSRCERGRPPPPRAAPLKGAATATAPKRSAA